MSVHGVINVSRYFRKLFQIASRHITQFKNEFKVKHITLCKCMQNTIQRYWNISRNNQLSGHNIILSLLSAYGPLKAPTLIVTNLFIFFCLIWLYRIFFVSSVYKSYNVETSVISYWVYCGIFSYLISYLILFSFCSSLLFNYARAVVLFRFSQKPPY